MECDLRIAKIAGSTFRRASVVLALGFSLPALAQDDLEEFEPPVLAPFSGPAGNRVLPPPAPLAGLDVPEPGDIQEDILREQTVTTGAKREQKLQDVPLTISWIPGEELQGTGAFSLCDTIQYFPGLECRRGAMRKAAVSARGLGSNFLSNRLLLLKDGRPYTDPWTGIFYPDETTPLSNVKQIEVIRGPGSSLYGSGAFSGVINLVQRTPDDLIAKGRNFGAEAKLLAGQWNTYRAETTVAGKTGDLKGMVTYYGLVSDGPELFTNPNLGIRDDQQWTQVHQVSAKVNYKIVTLDAEYNDGKIGRPGGNQISDVGTCGRCHYTPNDSEHVQNFNASAQIDSRVNDWLRVFAQGYTFFKRRQVELENDITDNLDNTLGKRRRFGGEARAVLSLGDLTATVGGDVKDDLVNNQNILTTLTSVNPDGSLRDDLGQQIFGAFVDAEYRPFEKLILGGGVRFDATEVSPNAAWLAKSTQLSPRASIVYHLSREITLRTNYGRAFRAPTLAELGINQQMYASTLLGNPSLRAETLDTLELAMDYWPKDNIRVTGTGFYSLARKFIDTRFTGGSTSIFDNVGDARVTGLELEAAAQIRPINSSFDIGYQFLYAKGIDNQGVKSDLSYAPRSRVYARGRTNFRNIAFGELYGLYVGARYDPSIDVSGGSNERIRLKGYFVASARVGANVVDGISVSLIGSNIFDGQYQEMHGFPMPQRSLFAELRFVY